ncbi:hypothetical protein L2E82_36189 [Cichorium intybus]|uniref:Uncharacterized protein n=1 Tax=Cichorium intybus TaxID=13427 RepID=A0ACB9BQV3_CICIN|nr:hypothetical protein L2E82_36189 [Cichorium intybus]
MWCNFLQDIVLESLKRRLDHCCAVMRGDDSMGWWRTEHSSEELVNRIRTGQISLRKPRTLERDQKRVCGWRFPFGIGGF